jgi:hypothetical protein
MKLEELERKCKEANEAMEAYRVEAEGLKKLLAIVEEEFWWKKSAYNHACRALADFEASQPKGDA